MFCPCDNCKKFLPDGMMPHVDSEEGSQCASCGFFETYSWWLDYEWDIAVENGSLDRPHDYGGFILRGFDGNEI